MKKKTRYILFLAVILVLTYIACVHQDRMWSEKSIVTEDVKEQLTAIGEQKAAWTSSALIVTQGDWAFRVDYSTDRDDNYAVVYSSREMPENAKAGSRGKVLAKIPLPKNANTAESTLHFDEGMTDLYIQIFHCDGNLTIDRIQLQDRTPYTDKYWAIGIVLFVGIMLYYLLAQYNTNRRSLKDRIVAAALFATVLYSSLPLMNTFLEGSDDLYFHLSRIEGIVVAMQNGEFPMWINMSGKFFLGYANPTLYPQLFLYIPAAFIYFGMSLMNAYKLFIVIINAATVIISYLCFSKVFRSRAVGLVTAIAYTLCLYRLVDVYTRGAMGEILSFVFLPVCFYGMYEATVGDEKKWPYLVIGITGVFSSHILSTTLVVFFMGIYFIILIPKMWHSRFGKRIFSFAKAGIITFLVNLYFIVPFLHYYRGELLRIFTRGNGRDAANSAAYLSQLFSTMISADSSRSDVAIGSTQGEMAITIGLVIPICCVIFAFVSLCTRKYLLGNIKQNVGEKRVNECFDLGNYALLGTILAIYLTSDLFPWEKIDHIPILSVLKNIQFPWRLLMIAQLFGVIVIGCLVQLFIWYRPKWKNAALLLTAGLVVMSAVPYIDSTIDMRDISDRALAGQAETDDLYRYPVLDESKVLEHYEYLGISSSVEGTDIKNFTRKGTTLKFHYQLPSGQTEAVIDLPLYSYPGYTLTVNGNEQDYETDDYGIMQFHTSVPEADVVVSCTGSPSWRLAYGISGVTVAVLVLYGILKGVKRHTSRTGSVSPAKAG